MSPKVSIIVPVYNVPEKYLRECLESLAHQMLKEIEIVVVDDGSTDGESARICDAYANRDPRVRVIHKANGGLCSARNAGFFASVGKYILFVDGDDWLEPAACEASYQAAEAHQIPLLMFGVCRQYRRRAVACKYSLAENQVFGPGECADLQCRMLMPQENLSGVYAKLIRRDYLLARGLLHDEALRQGAEGIEFNLRLFEGLPAAMFLGRCWYHYRYNEGSISMRHDEENHRLVLACFEQMKAFIDRSANRESLEPLFHTRLLHVLNTTAISGYFNPSHKTRYAVRKAEFGRYLEHSLIREALRRGVAAGMPLSRRLNLWFIRRRWFLPIHLSAILRKAQRAQL